MRYKFILKRSDEGAPPNARPLGAGRTIGVALVSVWIVLGPTAAAETPAQAEVRSAISSFLAAFNNLDWESFRQWFASDASLFNPEIPEVTQLGRIDGKEAIEASFRSVFDAARAQASGPPYLAIVPRNMRVQVLGKTAVVTFEFDREGGRSTGRRTFVLQKQSESWKIVHIHASNVPKPK